VLCYSLWVVQISHTLSFLFLLFLLNNLKLTHTTAVPDATTAAPLDGAVAAFSGGSSYIQSSVETTTTTTTTIAPVAYVEDPVTVFGDAIIAEGGTTEGVVNGTDDLPINGGVLTSSDATSGPDGTAKLEAALSEPVAIPNAGKHDIGPWVSD
jgi:hypothetical protein